jgi:hypothetical protein
LSLGREIVRMIHDIRRVSKNETAYARRKFTFPGGEVHLLLANESQVADLMEASVSREYDVKSATPPSQTN